MSFAFTNAGWNSDSKSGSCARPPRRALEIAGIVLGFIYAWPVALGYVVWKAFGYPLPKDAKSMFDNAFSRAGVSPAQGGWGFRGTGNSAFEEYRRAELARLDEERRRLHEESRSFAKFVDELKQAKDRQEFDAYMARRRANGGSESVQT